MFPTALPGPDCCAPSHPLLVAVHESDELGLLLRELLLPHHEVALTVGQLALHLCQAFERRGELVALLAAKRLAATAADVLDLVASLDSLAESVEMT